MQIVELPGDVMDSTKDIQLAIVVVDSVSIPYCWNFALVLQPGKLIVSEAESPDVVESAILIFSTKNEDILVVRCDSRTYSRRWHIILGLLSAFKENG